MRTLLLFLSLLLAAAACGPASPSTPAPTAGEAPRNELTQVALSATAAGTPTPTGPRVLRGGVTSEQVTGGLQLPANLVFAPDGRLFLTEVSLGRVRVIDRGQLQSEPVLELDVAREGEMGLLGLALDPGFAQNGYLYVFYAEPKDGLPWRNRVVRYTEANGRADNPKVILDDLPVSQRQDGSHNGGRLAFGPDGKLYVTFGEVALTPEVQNLGRYPGKILRLNPDGSVPNDGPFPGSAVYALGFRNPWGLTFQPTTGEMFITDNGNRGHDEVNQVRPGGNYGWPTATGIAGDPRFIDPLWDSYANRGGITGLAFYQGDLFRQLKGALLFCNFEKGRLMVLRPDPASADFRVAGEDIFPGQCNLDVAVGSEGAIYLATITGIDRLVPTR